MLSYRPRPLWVSDRDIFFAPGCLGTSRHADVADAVRSGLRRDPEPAETEHFGGHEAIVLAKGLRGVPLLLRVLVAPRQRDAEPIAPLSVVVAPDCCLEPSDTYFMCRRLALRLL